MIEHFQVLLRAIVENPNLRVAELPLMSEAELASVVDSPNRTDAPLPALPLAHRLFEAQAAAHPHRIAIESGEDSLSYAELNARANQLARRLRRLGIRPEDRVAIAVERSCHLGVGMLAILKAGAAFVPLDAAYPRERLAFMLADCGVRVLLTQRSLPRDCPRPCGRDPSASMTRPPSLIASPASSSTWRSIPITLPM